MTKFKEPVPLERYASHWMKQNQFCIATYYGQCNSQYMCPFILRGWILNHKLNKETIIVNTWMTKELTHYWRGMLFPVGNEKPNQIEVKMRKFNILQSIPNTNTACVTLNWEESMLKKWMIQFKRIRCIVNCSPFN